MLYYLLTVPGIESIAAREVQGSPKAPRVVAVAPGRVVFDYRGPGAALLDLGTAEDVFALIASDRLDAGRNALRRVHELVRRSPRLSEAVELHRSLRAKEPRRPTFRVVAQRIAGGQGYERAELGREVARAVSRALPTWKEVAEDAHAEVWVLQDGSEVLCGLRLSDSSMRHRTYRKVSLPAALRPVVARAMVMLSEPENVDVFLDPLCGAGTILIERGTHSRHNQLLGGDIDSAAVDAAKENIGPRHKPVTICRWDARRLPIADGSVDKIVTNLPFGKKTRAPGDERSFHGDFFAEAARVVRPGGIIVTLSNRWRMLSEAIDRRRDLQIESSRKIDLLGQPATIVKTRRVDA